MLYSLLLTVIPYFCYSPLTMTYTVTVTSKNQVTIPMNLARIANIKPGVKLIFNFDQKTKTVTVQKMLDILDELAGSVKIPQKYRKLNSAQLRKKTITDHFQKRAKRYLPE